MSAGLPTDDPWGDRQQGLAFGPFFDLLREPLPTAWPPETRFEYSNLGYGILGRVITNSSGIEYRDLVRTRFLEPLGMTATTYVMEEIPADELAHGYVQRDDAWHEEPIDGYGALASMGGVFTWCRPISPRWVTGFTDAFPPRDAPDDGHPLRRATRQGDAAGEALGRSRAHVGLDRGCADPCWRRLRLRPVHRRRSAARPGRGPRRRISRVRLEHDMAPGLRDRCRRRSQRPLRADVADRSWRRSRALVSAETGTGACASCRSVAGHRSRRGPPWSACSGAGTTAEAAALFSMNVDLDEPARPSPRGDRAASSATHGTLTPGRRP